MTLNKNEKKKVFKSNKNDDNEPASLGVGHSAACDDVNGGD
jgi:hypothetical protein